jgi:transposase-like protein
MLQGSKTFTDAQRRATAINQALDELNANTTLTEPVRRKAINNLLSNNGKHIRYRTVGWGSAKNSILHENLRRAR